MRLQTEMKKVEAGRSGRTFFLTALLVIFAAILIPLLLANDERNLKHVQTYLGLPATGLWEPLMRLLTPARPENEIAPIRKGKRLPAPQIALPSYAFSDLQNTPQHFFRVIQSNPRTMCDSIAKAGFGEMQWTADGVSTAYWECSSYTPVGETPADENSAPSSIFVSIRGSGEERVSLFRVKINIENPADSARAADLGAKAVSIFLTQARWDNEQDLVDKVRRLEDFDVRTFGSRIRMKREFGETPRYNFIANRDIRSKDHTSQEEYFDRGRWLTISDKRDVRMVGGMMAGNGTILTPARSAKPADASSARAPASMAPNAPGPAIRPH